MKWLWVDQTDDQLDFAQSYGFHIPARTSLAAKADKLKSGPAADAANLCEHSGQGADPAAVDAGLGGTRTQRRAEPHHQGRGESGQSELKS